MDRLRAGKVTYYHNFLFFFVVSRAWGLQAGDKIYTVMACIGCIFYGMAIMGSTYSKRELVLTSILCGSGILSVIFSGKIGAFFPAMAISASKDTDIGSNVRFCMKCWILTMLTKFFFVLLGIIPDNTWLPDDKLFPGHLRHKLGYGHPNIACAMLLISLLYIIYVYWERLRWYHFMSFIAVFSGTFFLTYSYTGTILAILLSVFCIVYRFMVKNNGMHVNWKNIIDKILALASVLPVLITFIFLILYDDNSSMGGVLNKLTTTRAGVSSRMMKNYPITLFGQSFSGKLKYEVLDNVFIYILLRFGIVIFLMFIIGYAMLIYRAYREHDTRLLLIICAFMAYGFMEMSVINPFMNFTILFMGRIIWKGNGYSVTYEFGGNTSINSEKVHLFDRR